MPPSSKLIRRRIRKVVSTHTHLRHGKFRQALVNRASKYFAITMAMLNTPDGIMTGAGAIEYENGAHAELLPGNRTRVIPIMIGNENTTAEMVFDAYAKGVRHIKFLPYLKTTHALYGVKNYGLLLPVLKAMEEMCVQNPNDRMYAHFHPAHPSKLHENDEEEYMFLPIFELLHQLTPLLPKTWEHLSDGRVIKPLLEMGENIAIGLTAHHPYKTATETYGQTANGVFKPTPGDQWDKEEITKLMLSGHPRVFYGPDDAPHEHFKKNDPHTCTCGADTTEYGILILLHIFQREGSLKTETDWQRFEDFTVNNACRFYNLPVPQEFLEVENEEFEIPKMSVVGDETTYLYMGGTKIPWRYVWPAQAAA